MNVNFWQALSHVPVVYALCLLATAVYWLLQSRPQGRRGLWPRLGLLLPLGLAALLGAPMLDVPALFGMGLAFALIGLYWPLPVLRPLHPQSWGWCVVGAVVGLYCLVAALFVDQNIWALLLAVVLLLYTLYVALWALGYGARQRQRRSVPQQPVQSVRLLPAWVRLQAATAADPPDLELTLEPDKARLHNVSNTRLEMLGWSAASGNEWRPLQQRSGAALKYLPVGEDAYLHAQVSTQSMQPMQLGGVRVWYTRQGQEGVYLFRADWVSSHAGGERVLN